MPNYPYIITPVIAYYNTPIDPTTVICYNCNEDRYYALSCPQPRNIGNIKEMEEGEISDKLGKEEP